MIPIRFVVSNHWWQARSGPVFLMKINFYWNTAIHIHLCTVYECFHFAVVKSSSCRRNHMTCKTNSICYLTLYRKFAALNSICYLTLYRKFEALICYNYRIFIFQNLPFLLTCLLRGIWGNVGRQTSKHFHDCRDFPKTTFHFRNPTCGYVMRPQCWQSSSYVQNALSTSSMLTPKDFMGLNS